MGQLLTNTSIKHRSHFKTGPANREGFKSYFAEEVGGSKKIGYGDGLSMTKILFAKKNLEKEVG